MPWVDLIDYYINLQRGIQTSILFLAGGREDTVGLQKSKRTIKKKHETTDKRKLKKKIKKALILTLLQILRDVSK